jgi:hypothetical protein
MNPKAMYCDSAVGTAAAISLPGLLQSGVIPIWPEMSGYPMVHAFEQAITRRGVRKVLFLPPRGPRLSNLSMERFRTSVKYQDRPAAAAIAFCVAAYANSMTGDRIERALDDLSRDFSSSM